MMGLLVAADLGSIGDHRALGLLSGLGQMFTYHFMVNAFVAGTAVAIGASVVGWFMVLRRQTFAGHTLAVIGFPGAAGAALLGLSATFGYFAICVAGAIVIGLVPRSTTGRAGGSDSAVIGTLQAFALASGVLFISLYRGFLNQLTALLFGSFLGITNTQVLVLGVVCVVAVMGLVVVGRPLFFASIDADVAAVRGVPVRLLSIIFMILLGLAVAEASQITGSLLVFALLVMPSATAQRLTENVGLSLVISMVTGILTTWCALSAAYFSVYPVGFYLTSFGFAFYLVALGIERSRDRRPMKIAGSGARR